MIAPETDTGLSHEPADDLRSSHAETVSLARNWLLAEPDLAFARAKRDAERMNLKLTPRLFAEARRSLGITAGPPRPAPKRKEPGAERRPDTAAMNDDRKAPSPMSAFVAEYLRAHPAAEYADLKAAAAEKGFKIAPITYGRARKEAGLAPMAKRPARPKAAREAERPARATATTRRGETAATGGGIGDVLDRLQRMAADRDRFQNALDDIARILRDVLPHE